MQVGTTQAGEIAPIHFGCRPQMIEDNKQTDIMASNQLTTDGMTNPHHPTRTNSIINHPTGTTNLPNTTTSERTNVTNTSNLTNSLTNVTSIPNVTSSYTPTPTGTVNQNIPTDNPIIGINKVLPVILLSNVQSFGKSEAMDKTIDAGETLKAG